MPMSNSESRKRGQAPADAWQVAEELDRAYPADTRNDAARMARLALSLRAGVERLADEWARGRVRDESDHALAPDLRALLNNDTGQPAGKSEGLGVAGRTQSAMESPRRPDCQCPPCPGRGNDGHAMTHCAECCFGTGVEADPDCPTHGARPISREAVEKVRQELARRERSHVLNSDYSVGLADAYEAAEQLVAGLLDDGESDD